MNYSVKKIIKPALSLSFIASQLFISAYSAQWQPLNNGFTGADMQIIAPNPSNQNEILAAGQFSGLYQSNDDAKTWTKLKGFDNQSIAAIAYNPANSQEIYLATAQNGLYKSSDDGQTWKEVIFFKDIAIGTVMFDPNNAKTILVGSNNKIFTSNDSGKNWRTLLSLSAADEQLISSIAIQPGHSNVIIAGLNAFWSASQSIYKTTDTGKHWKPVAISKSSDGVSYTLSRVSQISFASDNINRIYMNIAGELYQSNDLGETWQSIFSSYQVYCPSHTLNTKNTQELFVSCTNTGIYKSLNGGKSWRAVNGNFINANINGLVVANSSNPNSLYLGEYDSGIQHSIDDGTTWQPAAAGIINQDIKGFSFTADNDFLYTFTNDHLWLQGTNHAWKKLNFPLSYDWQNRIDNLVVNPADHNTFLVTATTKNTNDDFTSTNLYSSHDGGTTWTKSIDHGTVSAVEIDSRNPSIVFAGIYAGTNVLLISTDGGDFWQDSPTVIKQPPMSYINQIVINPLNDNEIYLCGSTNGRDDGRLVFKSLNQGKAWTQLPLAFGTPSASCSSMSINPTAPNILYLVAEDAMGRNTISTIYKSIDSGNTWSVISDRLPVTTFGKVVVDPVDPQTIYVATGTDADYASFDNDSISVYVSHDGGNSWATINTGLDNLALHSLAIKDGTLYAGTLGSGVFTLNTTR